MTAMPYKTMMSMMEGKSTIDTEVMQAWAAQADKQHQQTIEKLEEIDKLKDGYKTMEQWTGDMKLALKDEIESAKEETLDDIKKKADELKEEIGSRCICKTRIVVPSRHTFL